MGSCVSIDKKHKNETGIPLHGNFCGPGVPNIDKDIQGEARIKALKKIKPIDDIDKACQSHDICYIEKGYFNPACDFLIMDLLYINNMPEKCRILRSTIHGYFLSSFRFNRRDINNTISSNAANVIIGLAGSAFMYTTALGIKLTSGEKAPERWDKCNFNGPNNWYKRSETRPARFYYNGCVRQTARGPCVR